MEIFNLPEHAPLLLPIKIILIGFLVYLKWKETIAKRKKPKPFPLMKLPDELLALVLLHAPDKHRQYKNLRRVHPRFNNVIQNPAFQLRAVEKQFPEIFRILNVTGIDGISKAQLRSFQSYREELQDILRLHQRMTKSTRKLIVEFSGHTKISLPVNAVTKWCFGSIATSITRKDIFMQGLYVLDAFSMQSGRFGPKSVPKRPELLWDRFPDKYTAEVIRYTIRQLFNALCGEWVFEDLFDDPFHHVFDDIERAMVAIVFEHSMLFHYDRRSIRDVVEDWYDGEGPGGSEERIDTAKRRMIRLLMLRHECARNPDLWVDGTDSLFANFPSFHMLTDIIELGESLIDVTTAETFEDFVRREKQSVLKICDRFEKQDYNGSIDFLAIGKALRGEATTRQQE